MSKKARKVKAKPRPAAKKASKPRRPVVVKKRMKGGDATPREEAPAQAAASARALAAAHDEAPAVTRPAAGSPAMPPAPPGGGLSRLQRMMAASSDNDAGLTLNAKSADMPAPVAAQAAPDVRKAAAAPPPPPPPPAVKGRTVVVDNDVDSGEDGFVVRGGGGKTKVEKAEDGVAVVSKGPAKFSLDDMEALRKAIVIKGSGLVVAGINLDELKYNEEGLVAVVAQDRATGAVLMQAWANKDALKQSLTTNEMTYWSRQRNKLWTKGEESGHGQKLVELKVDCDKDAILAIVEQTGPACHRETGTCFYDDRAIPVAGFLGELDRLVADRAKKQPEGSYTTKLLEDPSLAAGKVVEEAKEVALVLKGKPNPDSLQHEAADLLFHLLVACRGKGVGLREVVAELLERHGSGKDGKDGKHKA
ncbi:MAG: phosphoribosyl-AMP cyclohydrolase / phosphoribosyl-ATP pyrophosphohydrolase [Thermoplasmata archaeon]|nr:phosphoribosyl-AMP cyclohydrolase / phosphoribosyl-ATP pyrophosphohydrolase [Thermoplasmata archaeon]